MTPLAVRLPASYRTMIDALAQEKGLTITALVVPWVTRGYDAETGKDRETNCDLESKLEVDRLKGRILALIKERDDYRVRLETAIAEAERAKNRLVYAGLLRPDSPV